MTIDTLNHTFPKKTVYHDSTCKNLPVINSPFHEEFFFPGLLIPLIGST